MAQKPASAAADHVWTSFESEALPHVDRLFRLAMWFERNRSEAEDLVQETLMRAWRGFDQFRGGTNARAWLFRILLNTFYGQGRKGRLTVVPLGDVDRAGPAGNLPAPGPREPRRGIKMNLNRL